MRLGLSVYGTTFAMGIHPKSGRPAIKPVELMDQALAAGLEGVEIPFALLKEHDPLAAAKYAREKGLFITVATGGYDPQKLAEAIHLASEIGSATVRTVVGGAGFGGDRRPLAGRWREFMQEVFNGLSQAAAVAEQEEINLAVENHQDLASEELIWLCESIGSPYFGINLDTGNPLATAEDPIDFAERVAPYLKNVHLKDYYVYYSEEGYRLVRSPLGQGVIDFPALFGIFSMHCPNVTMSIELGALEARHTRVLADDYWTDYPPRTAAQLAKVMRLVHCNAKPPGDWRTPYERGEPEDAIVAYEQQQLAASLAYIVPLWQKSHPYAKSS